MNVKEFEIEEKQDVITLWERCGLVVPQNNPVKDIERKMQVNPELFLVVTQEKRVIGTVMGGYEGHRGWINYLAVCPSRRRQGIAKRLMLAIESRLKDKGCPKINLQVRHSNTEVSAFYEAIGYSDDEVRSYGKRLENDQVAEA